MISFVDSGQTTQAVIAIILVILVVLAPVSMHRFLLKNKSKLMETDYKIKYWAMYLGLKIEKNISLLYYVFYLWRRLLVCAAIVFLAPWPVF